ncbi:hypothetical protein D9M73_252790 [compost metagenome]
MTLVARRHELHLGGDSALRRDFLHRNLKRSLLPLIASRRGEIARITGLPPFDSQRFIRINQSVSRHHHQQRQLQVIQRKAQLAPRSLDLLNVR